MGRPHQLRQCHRQTNESAVDGDDGSALQQNDSI